MEYETPTPEELVLPMPDDEYVNWLLTDRYGDSQMEEESVLNFLSLINSAADWEEKEMILYKVLAGEYNN